MNARTQVATLLLISTVMSVNAQQNAVRSVTAVRKPVSGRSMATHTRSTGTASQDPSGSFITAALLQPSGELPNSINKPVSSRDSLDLAIRNASPEPGKIIQDSVVTSIGLNLLTLSNGVKVMLKHTKFEPGKVIFQAFSPGGSSLYDDNNFQSAANATRIISGSGLANLDAGQLARAVEGSELEIKTFIGERSEGLSGFAASTELERTLQLIHLSFTAPRRDTAVFRQILQQWKQSLLSDAIEPESIFRDSLAALMAGYNPRRTALNVSKIDQIKFERIHKIYNDRFGDASDFVFVFVGDFDVALLKPQLELYLGSLPGTGRQETARDLAIHTPEGKFRKEWRFGNSGQVSVRMVMGGEYEYSRRKGAELMAIAEILQRKLREKLKESDTGKELPVVTVEFSKFPAARYTFLLSFGANPAKLEKMIASAEIEIRRLKVFGPSVDDLDRFINGQMEFTEEAIAGNDFWLAYLAKQYQDQEDLAEVVRSFEMLDKLDRESIRQSANLYLGESNLVTVLWYQENVVLTASK